MKTSVFRKFRPRNFPLLSFLLFAVVIVLIALFTKPVQAPKEDINVPKEIFENKNYHGFENWAKKKGARIAYQALKAYFKNNEPDAHDFAHVIGNVAASQIDIDGIKVCDNFFNYGCFHGFMQVYLQKHGVESVPSMEKSCFDLGTVSAPSCIHGIGHGLMMEASYNLDHALVSCQLLKQVSQTYCFDGVFMERIAGSMLPDSKKLKVTEENLFEPCSQIRPRYGKECWRNQVAVWFRFFGSDTTKIGSYCASLGNDYWQTCFESMGLLNVQNVGNDVNRLVVACQIVNDRAHNYCLIGEVKELLFEGKAVDVARSLCDWVTLANWNDCLQTFERLFGEYQQRFSQISLQ